MIGVMSTLLVLQILLTVTIVIAVCVVFLMFQVRSAYAEQRGRFVRTISAAERLQILQPELLECLRRIESDANALQKIALQIESAVAVLQEGVSSSVGGAAERQTRAIESFLDHVDAQEERLEKTLNNLSDSIRAIQPGEHPGPQRHDDIDHSRLRREVLRQGPEVRFSVLKQWTAINALSILHRASRGWSVPNDLIATIPPYLEAEAAVLNDSVLLIGTRDHSERLAIPLKMLDPSSEFGQWFDPAEGQTRPPVPAILAGSGGDLKLMAKGTNSAALPAA